MAAASAFTVIMVRHGESVYNQENRFCGWYDADLATSGVEEAKKAGKVTVKDVWNVAYPLCHRCSYEFWLLVFYWVSALMRRFWPGPIKACQFWIWGFRDSLPSVTLPSPLSFSPSPPSFPFPGGPHPLNKLGVLGSAVSSHSGVWGEAPANKQTRDRQLVTKQVALDVL